MTPEAQAYGAAIRACLLFGSTSWRRLQILPWEKTGDVVELLEILGGTILKCLGYGLKDSQGLDTA